jgi:uncharacterized protein YeaO (DUF488 family)
MIRIKRAYEPASPDDGHRFLVERLWPRGMKKEALEMEAWLKDVAPSTELRKWYGHELERWPEFQRRYRRELDANPAAWEPLVHVRGTLTLLFSARDEEHNSAVVLREYLNEHRRPRASRAASTASHHRH